MPLRRDEFHGYVLRRRSWVQSSSSSYSQVSVTARSHSLALSVTLSAVEGRTALLHPPSSTSTLGLRPSSYDSLFTSI